LTDFFKFRHSICDKTNQYIDVPSIKLDNNNFLNEKIDFIKIDVEGAEMLVLDGMTKLLEKNNNVKIIMEYNPLMCKNLDISAVNYITKLNELKQKQLRKLTLQMIYNTNQNFSLIYCVLKKAQK